MQWKITTAFCYHHHESREHHVGTAMTRIGGFWIYWGGEHYVWAEREAPPKHKYRFEVSADWNQIGKLWILPVDVADRDPVKHAERLAKKAKEAVEEFLREELGD